MAKRSAPEVTETETPPDSEVEAELEPETEPEVELEPESAPEDGDTLYARATELKIKGRSKMKRSELAEAVSAAEAQLAAAEAFKEDEKPVAPPVAAEGPAGPRDSEGPPKVATPEQVNKIAAASTDQLEMVVADPGLPPHLRAVVTLELGRRTEASRQASQAKLLQTPLERYKVTKGGRYVTKEGFVTELPEGSLVTPLTHDVRHLRDQGIEWVPATVVSVGLDELGKQISEVR
jgi:hypothetical protein